MINSFTVKTSALPIISDKQAKDFALVVYAYIKEYISAHQQEFEQWQREQDGERIKVQIDTKLYMDKCNAKADIAQSSRVSGILAAGSQEGR